MRVLFLTFFDPDNYGVRCLAAHLRSHKHDVHILQVKSWQQKQATAIPDSPAVLHAYTGTLWLTQISEDSITPVELQLCAEAAARWKPDVIGISIRGVLHHILPRVVRALKQACPSAFLVGGGIGPTLNPEFLLSLGADAVIRGEGEEPLLALVNALEHHAPWQQLPSIAYMASSNLVQNPLHPLVPLDRFPHPLDDPHCFSCIECNTYEQSPMDRTAFPGNPLLPGRGYYVMTSRGCIGKCSYCSTPSVHRLYNKDHKCVPRLRLRSLASVLEELKEAKNRGATRIMFHDDFFIRSTKKLREFFNEYKKHINIPFIAYFHPQQLNNCDGLLQSIVEAGVMTFCFGLQTADDTFCKNIYRRARYIDDYGHLCKKIRAHGVNVTFHFIGGNPLESEIQFEKNMAFLRQFEHDPTGRCQVSFISYYLQYYEGVDLVDMFPGIESMPRSVNDWLHKSILLNMAALAEPETIKKIWQDAALHEDSGKLMYLRQCMLRDRHHQYLFEEIRRLQGKEVYFWGCGDLYRYKRHLFQGVQPRCILVDTLGSHPDSVDGIPIRHPDEVLNGVEILPIVVFAKDQNTIYRKILSKYPACTDIVSCAML